MPVYTTSSEHNLLIKLIRIFCSMGYTLPALELKDTQTERQRVIQEKLEGGIVRDTAFYEVDRFPCRPAATCSRWFLARRFFYPEDGGDTFLRNVGSHKIYTAPHPRRRHSSQSQP
jgi:hypothetical protein